MLPLISGEKSDLLRLPGGSSAELWGVDEDSS